MKTVTNRPSFQGDLMIRRVEAIPATARKAEAAAGRHILAHSETGHHHVIDAEIADRFIDETNAFIAWLQVTDPGIVEHLRNYDTHEPLFLEPGIHEVRQQREYVAKGFRRVAD